MIRQVLRETGRVNPRACKLPHEVMMWVVLAMGIFTNLPIRQVFKQARRLRVAEATPCRSALCVARQRLGLEPVQRLYERTVHPLATPETPGAFYRGWRLVAMDGTVEDVPDRPANAAYFGRSIGQTWRWRVPASSQVELGGGGYARRVCLPPPPTGSGEGDGAPCCRT